MKRASKFITLLLIFAIMFVVGGSLVITYPDEYTIVRQFGEIVRVTDTAGVSLKLPVIQTSSTLPKSLQLYDIPESELALLLERWEEHLPEGFSLAYLPSPGFVKLRLTAKGDQVFNLDARYDSLKEALEGQRYTEGENGGTERELGELLMLKGKTIATAESCTGGNIATQLTSIAGASAYFKGSVVAYANDVKERVLGVRPETLEQFGAVSEPVVRQMAEGVRRLIGTDYAVSTSGIAGPTGGTVEKPVGTVWIGVAGPERTIARKFVFSFTRERNIGKATMKAIEMVIEEVRNGAVNK